MAYDQFVGLCDLVVAETMEEPLMIRLVSLTITIALLLSLIGCNNKPTLQDISPDLSNGTSREAPSSAGLTVALAGGTSRLYAVSLNAGVWRSDGPEHAWVQLAQSPPRAYSIAIDPTNAQHLAVGEREDDKKDVAARRSGVWESFDSGDTWSYILDPRTLGCSAQAVPAVVFNAEATLFAATSCGVARRASGNPKFEIATDTSGLGPINAITLSQNGVWARTANRLLIADEIGMRWEIKVIPPQFTFMSQGEVFSLAASDRFAYLSCCTVPEPPCGGSNKLLIYNLGLDNWTIQPTLPDAAGKPALGCDGTGLGGSKFVRGFMFSGGTSTPVFRLFVSSAQEIYEAVGFDANGAATGWSMPLGASCSGCTNQDPVHSDFWDFLLDPRSGHMWVANDGGVYERKTLHPGFAWVMRNEGLHTHHIHTLTLMGHNMPAPSMAYPTSDNQGWYTNLLSSPSAWRATDNLGDANWSLGDAANPHHAVIALRRDVAAVAQDTAPYLVPITVSYDRSFDGPGTFQFIQTTIQEEVPDNTLDAILLTTLPLQYMNENKVLEGVQGDLGGTANAGRMVLLRKHNFQSAPDINLSKGTGWSVDADPPAGATRFWVTGGHDNTLYYVFAVQGGQGKLFKQNGWENGKTKCRS